MYVCMFFFQKEDDTWPSWMRTSHNSVFSREISWMSGVSMSLNCGRGTYLQSGRHLEAIYHETLEGEENKQTKTYGTDLSISLSGICVWKEQEKEACKRQQILAKNRYGRLRFEHASIHPLPGWVQSWYGGGPQRQSSLQQHTKRPSHFTQWPSSYLSLRAFPV